jgi:hypothetical protein
MRGPRTAAQVPVTPPVAPTIGNGPPVGRAFPGVTTAGVPPLIGAAPAVCRRSAVPRRLGAVAPARLGRQQGVAGPAMVTAAQGRDGQGR